MSELKYKVGDKVRIKSLDWYNKNKSKRGSISFPYEAEVVFTSEMSSYCGQIVTISQKGYTKDIGFYRLRDDKGLHMWTDEMIECLVEEETKPKFKVGDKVITDTNMKGKIIEVVEEGWYNVEFESYNGISQPNSVVPEEHMSLVEDELLDEYEELTDRAFKGGYEKCKSDIELNGLQLPKGYQFVDENGNIINTQKIILKKKLDDKLKLESTKKVREYWSEYTRIFIEIYDDDPNECILTHLYTFEGYRQKGHAKKALAEAELIAKELGCHKVHLKVETDTWMHNWYLRCGYNWYKNADEGYTWLTKSI